MLRGVVGVALVCALAGVAHADNKQVAKDAYTEGKRHYDLGEYDAALAAFKKAYLNYEEPVFLFNIAQCYRQLGDNAGALRSYKAFLRNWPKAPNREMVERVIAELETAPASVAPDAVAPATGTKPPDKPLASTTPSPATPPAAAAESKPAPPPSARAASKPAPSTTQHAEPAPTPAAPTPAHVASQAAPAARAADRPTPVEELPGMVEVEPNFDRPSGSAKPLKWWAWTLIAVGVGGLVAAAVVVGVTQSGGDFTTTLPPLNVSNHALGAAPVGRSLVKVRF